MQGIAKGLTTEGLGMVEWTMPSPNGNQTSFQARAYYVPKANQWLLTPQHFLQHRTNKNDAWFVIQANRMEFMLMKKGSFFHI